MNSSIASSTELSDGLAGHFRADISSKPAATLDATSLEAIATVFALEVPRVALLVLHPSAPVARAVAEMRALGINAHGLDVLDRDRGGSHLLRKGTTPEDTPTLLVATLATIRGLDLPDLTHVFILGATDALDHNSYTHAAGRVGRFGRSGKVITVVESRYTAKHINGKKTTVVDAPQRMSVIYQRLHVVPVKVEHFPTIGAQDGPLGERRSRVGADQQTPAATDQI